MGRTRAELGGVGRSWDRCARALDVRYDYPSDWSPPDRSVVLFLAGDVDLAAMADLQGALTDALVSGADVVVVDLRDVTSLDAAVVLALIEAVKDARAVGTVLTFRGRVCG